MRGIKGVLPILLWQMGSICWAVPKTSEQSAEGIRASVAMEIKSQIGLDIRTEFSKLQKELIAQIKTELSTEVSKIKDEVTVKLDANEAQTKTLKNELEKTLQAVDDLEVRIKTGQKTTSELLQETNQNLVDQFYAMKSSVTEEVGQFKVELQQSKSHLDNFKSSTLGEITKTLSEHTEQLYKSIDANQHDLILKVQLMQVSLNKRVADYHNFALREFNQRELTIGRKIEDQFIDMTKDLNLSLTKHQGAVAKVFDSKVDQQRKTLEDSESSLLGRVNSTMIEAIDRMSNHLSGSSNQLGILMKENENNINNTLHSQVEEIQKYIMPTMKQFTDTLTSEMINVKQVIENQFNDSLDQVSEIQISITDVKSDTQKLVSDFTATSTDNIGKFRTIENKLESAVVRLNKSMSNEFYSQQLKLTSEIKDNSQVTNTNINANQALMKNLIDNTVVKSINDALDVMKGQFEDIDSKLTNIEDEEEDVIPTITEAVQNIVKDGVREVRKDIEFSISTPIKGKLDTIQTMVEKLGKNGA